MKVIIPVIFDDGNRMVKSELKIQPKTSFSVDQTPSPLAILPSEIESYPE
jgi:hypothetical protein